MHFINKYKIIKVNRIRIKKKKMLIYKLNKVKYLKKQILIKFQKMNNTKQ